MNLDDVSRLLIALAVCDWVFTAVIFVAYRRIPEPALAERTVVSVILSTVATFAAILGAARLGVLTLPNGIGILLLCLALVLVSAPQFIWVLGLWLGKFR